MIKKKIELVMQKLETKADSVPIKTRIKLEKMLKEHSYVLCATNYDIIDALCGVISFVVLDLCQFYGMYFHIWKFMLYLCYKII